MQKANSTKGKKEKTASADDIAEVRKELIRLIEKFDANPALRKDPVTQALAHQVCGQVVKDYGSDQSFKTVGVAMNALRSAGVFDTSTVNPNASEGPRPEPKSKARSIKAETPQNATEKGQKMRGLDRGIDFLLVFGYLSEDDIKIFRALREDPNRLVKFTKNGEELQRRVKDTGDWDLLYSMDKELYGDWMAKANQCTLEFETSTGIFEPEKFLAHVLPSLEKNSNGDWSSNEGQGLRSVLKGPPLETALKYLKKYTSNDNTPIGLFDAVHDQIIGQRWFKFGKSPTLD